MSAISKFKFVSPGIFINEIDNSQLPNQPDAMGPVIIGRTERGPALVPTRVHSFEEFVNVFGAPIATEAPVDVWREGNRQGPTYASYAAQAWLASGEAPVTVVRLLGGQDPDATQAGKAGWQTTNGSFTETLTSNGGAYGLFIVDSGSQEVGLTGSLAAVWYIDKGHMALSGTLRGHVAAALVATSSVGEMIRSVGANNEFKALIYDNQGDVKIHTNFNFSRTSDKYIRKVFNTNPQLVNTTITNTSNQETYWLGQTYARFLDDTTASGSSAGDTYGVILPLASGSAIYGSNFRGGYKLAKTGWLIGQDLTTNHSTYDPTKQTKLFRFVARDSGEEAARRFKISIANVKPATTTDDIDPYGTFDVLVRDARDTDNAIRIIERYSNCNLNPNSLDYIARKIGDRYQEWNDNDQRFRYYGNFDNVSKYFYIEVDPEVDAGMSNTKLLPFGYYGPVRYKGFTIISGATNYKPFGAEDRDATATANSLVAAVQSIMPETSGTTPGGKFHAHTAGIINVGFDNLGTQFTGSFKFPSIPLRISASDGFTTDPRNAYFGINPMTTQAGTQFDEDYSDYVYPLAGSPSGLVDDFTAAAATEHSFVFSLDDIRVTGSATSPKSQAFYESGSRAAGKSYTALHSASAILEAAEYNKFTLPVNGGFDGLDIKEVEPFRNSRLDDSSNSNANYTFYTVKRAISSVSDAEQIECNLMVMPNIQNESLTNHLIQTCEERGDALAVIDLKGDYLLSSEGTSTAAERRPSVDSTITNLRSRGINSSYGCAFFPYVQIRDNINGAILDCPPSVVALGTFASSQATSQLWFAPAGFNRGGLSQGAAGIPVIGVKERLNSKDRDKLYAANVNPIATFPSEGIVVFGQKTLQITPSALDRINVRRLLIFLKKEISRIAATILFDPNVEVTWARFRNQAETFLAGVKAGLGLSEYKVVLDSTTTTPDLIDRNALYAKIFLKPARAIEFIAIDFVITRTGASFED